MYLYVLVALFWSVGMKPLCNEVLFKPPVRLDHNSTAPYADWEIFSPQWQTLHVPHLINF